MAVDFDDPGQVEAFKERTRKRGVPEEEIETFINSKKSSTLTVQPGETLSGISAREGTSVEELAIQNRIQDPDILAAGQTLEVGPAEAQSFQKGALPGKFKVNAAFGQRNKADVFSGGINFGVDFNAPTGTPVAAPPGGNWVVVESFGKATRKGFVGNRDNRGFGNSIVLQNRKTGEKIRFSHLSPHNVRPGQIVKGGQMIVKSGNTGNSTGSHLDVEFTDASGRRGDILKSKYRRSFI